MRIMRSILGRRRIQREIEAKRAEGHAVTEAMQEMHALLDAGDKETAALRLAEAIERHPAEYMLRLFAMAVYDQVGDPEASVEQLAIALILEPDTSAPYMNLARRLKGQGRAASAMLVAERGWEHASKHYHRRQLEEERAKYFERFEAP
jgi:predicted Zn-dependent protease